MPKQLYCSSKRPFKLMAFIFSSIFVLILLPFEAWSCADRLYSETIPREDIDNLENIAVVKIEFIEQTGEAGKYGYPFHMKGIVVKQLKGALRKEMELSADTVGENPHSACPIGLKVGKTYLLFFNGKKSPYALARYGTLYMDDSHPLFSSYLKQIEYLLSSH